MNWAFIPGKSDNMQVILRIACLTESVHRSLFYEQAREDVAEKAEFGGYASSLNIGVRSLESNPSSLYH